MSKDLIINQKNKIDSKLVDIVKQKIKDLSWEDWIFIGFLLFLLIQQGFVISELEQLPSPMYGGDYYYHLGKVNHLMRGGSIFESPQLADEAPWSPFLHQGLIAAYSSITNSDPLNVMLNSSLVFMLIGMTTLYLFGSKLFKNKLAGIMLATFYITRYPLFKYTDFTRAVMFPLFVFMLWLAIDKRQMKYYISAGVIYGLVGIAHTLAFLSATIVLFVLFAYLILLKHIKTKPIRLNITRLKKGFVENIKIFAIIFIIGFVIAQLYWFQPIFNFNLETPNTISEYDSPDISDVGMISTTLSGLNQEFGHINFSTIGAAYNSLKRISVFIGIILIFLIPVRKFRHNYLLILISSYVLARFHYIITEPLLGREFFSILYGTWFNLLVGALFFIFVIGVLLANIKRKLIKDVIMISIIALLLVTSIFIGGQSRDKNQFFQSGKTPIPPYLSEVTDWTKQNTEQSDVFLSTNEISFMFSSLTGNKVMTGRRAHSGMWVDVDRRWADAAVILYGNNSETRKELIDKYDLKYIYWQYNWISLDYRFDENGNLVSWFDPLLVRDIDDHEEYLTNNGVTFTKTKTWLDPANKKEGIKQFDVLFVQPKNWTEAHPWDDSLDNHLSVEKDFYQQGMLVARIYKVSP